MRLLTRRVCSIFVLALVNYFAVGSLAGGTGRTLAVNLIQISPKELEARKFALCIGIGAYSKATGLQQLDYAAADARELG